MEALENKNFSLFFPFPHSMNHFNSRAAAAVVVTNNNSHNSEKKKKKKQKLKQFHADYLAGKLVMLKHDWMEWVEWNMLSFKSAFIVSKEKLYYNKKAQKWSEWMNFHVSRA